MRARRMAVCGAVAVAVVSMVMVGAPVSADAVRPMYWQVDPDGQGPVAVGDAVPGSSVAVQRSAGGVTFQITTSGLTPGHGYTVWFFNYDNPDACVTGDNRPGSQCTTLDLFNPAALGSMMWGRAGGFVTADTATFSGSRPTNTGPCLTEPVVVEPECAGSLFGHGLHSPLTSEIHFVLRDHGPDQAGVDDETSTINGGCDPATHEGLPVWGPGWGTPGDYACIDPQGS